MTLNWLSMMMGTGFGIMVTALLAFSKEFTSSKLNKKQKYQTLSPGLYKVQHREVKREGSARKKKRKRK